MAREKSCQLCMPAEYWREWREGEPIDDDFTSGFDELGEDSDEVFRRRARRTDINIMKSMLLNDDHYDEIMRDLGYPVKPVETVPWS